MQSICFEDGEGVSQGSLFHFPFQRGPLALAAALGKKLCKSEGATKMATSSIDCIFTVSRGHLDEGRNALKKKLLS